MYQTKSNTIVAENQILISSVAARFLWCFTQVVLYFLLTKLTRCFIIDFTFLIQSLEQIISLKKKEIGMPERFAGINRLPPCVFGIVTAMKTEARRRGEDVIDLDLSNPDQGTPQQIIDKLIEAASNPRNHRYSASKGITRLRSATCDRYKKHYGVDLDPETEAVVTIGSEEGLSHHALAMVEPGDVVLTTAPAYPTHPYSVILAVLDTAAGMSASLENEQRLRQAARGRRAALSKIRSASRSRTDGPLNKGGSSWQRRSPST